MLLRLLRNVGQNGRRARADALHVRALECLRRGEPGMGLELLDQALRLDPQRPDLLARRADALLLCRKEADALAAYRRTLPDMDASPDPAGIPSRAAHGTWLRYLSRVAVPDDVTASPRQVDLRTWSNYASLLANTGCTRAAAALFDRLCREDPADGYAWAAQALIHTLNKEWQQVIPAARQAKALGTELFDASMDLCLLAAALGSGRSPGELDDYLDWRPLHGGDVDGLLGALPPLAEPMPRIPPGSDLVFFIACDGRYLREYALALALSIKQHCPTAAVHLHVFSPDPSCPAILRWLADRIAPLPLYTSHEAVAFEQFGGVGRYCAAARFARLFQWTRQNEARVVMLDADSLVRHDLAPRLAKARDIALIHASGEPMWHELPAFFTSFRASPAAHRFLGRQAALMASNLVQRRVQVFMDQVGLLICRGLQEDAAENVEHLPLEYCDSTFQPGSLVWTVTQSKEQALPFRNLREAVLASAGVSVERVLQPGWPAGAA